MIDTDLRVGDWVTIPHKEFGDITFIVIGEDHDAPDTVTLLTRDIMKILPFDAMERWNPDKSRQKGNNRYIHSNIRQWLNSDAEAGNWYKPQHEYDEKPEDVNVVHDDVSYVESPWIIKRI